MKQQRTHFTANIQRPLRQEATNDSNKTLTQSRVCFPIINGLY